MKDNGIRLLDIMNVPAEGDSASAIVEVRQQASPKDVECDVLVVGGGMGGVAAAWAAARTGAKVCLLEETDWIGGQITAQGVSALDEHEYIEEQGGTRTYYLLREKIRDHYLRKLSSVPPEPFNPGNCWVTRLAFEPKVARETLMALLNEDIESERLQIYLRTKSYAVEMSGDSAKSLFAVNLDTEETLCFRFKYVLDATELGDLLPLAGIEHNIGAEAKVQTGEKHAQPEKRMPRCVQSCTYTFALEKRPPGECPRITKPSKYEHYRDSQPYSLRIHVHGGEIYGEESGWLDYQVFEKMPCTKGSLWTYRRLIDSSSFPDQFEYDVTMFNWPGNDYRDKPLVEQSQTDLANILQDAKRVSLGFAYWLQTEAPNPQGRFGFPELKLRPDIMGSCDGLSKHPYIREARRICALITIKEQDVSIEFQKGEFSHGFRDSVGIGWYPIDIHQAGKEDLGVSTRTRPFQIPLGALIPVRALNLIAANKNIGSTHITNGCYRLHPVEWNIGEVAGLLAAHCIRTGQLPKIIWNDDCLLNKFQDELKREGIPLKWV